MTALAPSSPPEDIYLKAESSESVSITWNPPAFSAQNGIIRQYSIIITIEQPHVNYSRIIISNETELNITGLNPYTTYEVQINAETILPGPFSSNHFIRTLELSKFGY